MAKSYIKLPKDKVFEKLSNANLSNNKLPKDAFDKLRKNKDIKQPQKIKSQGKVKIKKF